MNRSQQDTDVFELLAEDHDRISHGLQELDEALSTRSASAAVIYDGVKDRLRAHAKAEEAAIYPRLRQERETSDLALEALEQHGDIDKLLRELDSFGVDRSDFEDTFRELKEAVEHHVEEEEEQIFREMRETFERSELEEMADAFVEAKEKFRKGKRAA